MGNPICKLTIYVVDLEQKPDLVICRLSRELVYGINELLQRNRARVVLVEDLENALREEGLPER